MTYWAREHEHNLRRIGDMMRELEHAYEDIIPALQSDLRDDEKIGTIVSREFLNEARHRIAQAMNALTTAQARLPTPQFRATVHPTAAEVLERDA